MSYLICFYFLQTFVIGQLSHGHAAHTQTHFRRRIDHKAVGSDTSIKGPSDFCARSLRGASSPECDDDDEDEDDEGDADLFFYVE